MSISDRDIRHAVNSVLPPGELASLRHVTIIIVMERDGAIHKTGSIYVMYYNVARAGPSHDRWHAIRARKIWRRFYVRFLRYDHRQTDKLITILCSYTKGGLLPPPSPTQNFRRV